MRLTYAAATMAIMATSCAYGFHQASRVQVEGYRQTAMPPKTREWHPAGPGDVRGPCPMFNTLANHGYISHDGRNITKANAIRGLFDSLHFDSALASLLWDQAIIVNPEPNATFFTLEQLNRHNVLEHDASLSRMDAYYGNNHLFNPAIFAETRSYWTDETLTAQMLANSKLARMVTSRAYNPNYTFTNRTEEFSLGEVAAPVVALGNYEDATVSRALVEYLFEHERLPTELGWTVRNETVKLTDALFVAMAIRKATGLFTPESDPNATDAGATHGVPSEKRSFHFL